MTGPAGRQTSCPDSCQNRKDLRIRILVRGIVQGVGFRPFLHRLAQKLALTGWARNTSGGLEAELEGKEADLASFVERVRTFPPPMAVVEEVSVQGPWPAAGYQGFSILESALSDEATLLSPDMAPCPACRAELRRICFLKRKQRLRKKKDPRRCSLKIWNLYRKQKPTLSRTGQVQKKCRCLPGTQTAGQAAAVIPAQ